MDLKYKKAADLTEKRAVKLLSNSGFNAHLNNENNQLAIDLLVDQKLIDVQFSFNFNRYGDIRIDLFSSFHWNEHSNKDSFSYDLKCGLSLIDSIQKHMDPKKKHGKYFDNNNKMKGVIYFLYDDKMPNKIEDFSSKKITGIVYVPTQLIRKEIIGNLEKHSKRIIINNKEDNNVKETHNSAFIPISLKYLIQKYKLPIANNRKEFKEKISQYISKDLNISSDLLSNSIKRKNSIQKKI